MLFSQRKEKKGKVMQKHFSHDSILLGMLVFVAVTVGGLQQGFNEAVTHFALLPVGNMWSDLE